MFFLIFVISIVPFESASAQYGIYDVARCVITNMDGLVYMDCDPEHLTSINVPSDTDILYKGELVSPDILAEGQRVIVFWRFLDFYLEVDRIIVRDAIP